MTGAAGATESAAADFCRSPSEGAVRGVVLGERRRRLEPAAHRRLGNALAEDRGADHADVVGPAGARGVRVGKGGEVERRGLAVALAPAGDVGGLVRPEHVAGLADRGGLAAHRVDAVDRKDDEDATRRSIGEAHGVAVARPPGDPGAAARTPARERLAAAAVDDLHVDQRADGACGRCGAGGRRGGGEQGEQGATGGHGGSPGVVTTTVERPARANGVNRQSAGFCTPRSAAFASGSGQKQHSVHARPSSSPSTVFAPSLVFHQRSTS